MITLISRSHMKLGTNSHLCSDSIAITKFISTNTSNFYVDKIGPVHKPSNIRVLQFEVLNNETKLQKMYRERKQETQDWHIAYWTDHNQSFRVSKKAFTVTKLKEKYGESADKHRLSAEDFAEFYQQFLEKNREKHAKYNSEWYSKNFTNIWLAMLVKLEKLYIKLNYLKFKRKK